MGTRALIHHVHDAPYPEQVRIAEMLAMAGGTFQPLDELEFLRLLDMHDGR